MGSCLTDLLSLDINRICEDVPRIQELQLRNPVLKNEDGLSIVQSILNTMGDKYPDFYKGYDVDYEPITIIRYTTNVRIM